MPEPANDPLKVAIVLRAGLEPGVAANVSACLAAGLAAARPGWAGHPLRDAAGLSSVASSHLPIGVLRAEDATLRALVHRLATEPVPEGACLSLFPAYAREMHDCVAYWDRHAQTVHADVEPLGVGLVGPKRWVARATGSFALWR